MYREQLQHHPEGFVFSTQHSVLGSLQTIKKEGKIQHFSFYFTRLQSFKKLHCQ